MRGKLKEVSPRVGRATPGQVVEDNINFVEFHLVRAETFLEYKLSSFLLSDVSTNSGKSLCRVAETVVYC